MLSGLTFLYSSPSRVLKEENVTYTDPWIEEAFNAIAPPAVIESFKNWSRSFYNVEAHIESLHKYDKKIFPEPTDPVWTETKNYAFEEFSKLGKVNAKSAETDLKSVPYQQGTSAGFGYHYGPQPYPTRKGPPKSGNHRRALRIAAKTIHSIRCALSTRTFDKLLLDAPMSSTPDVAFTRTQLTELPNLKVRNVFGEAFHYVLEEGLFAEPLIRHFMNIDSFYYIGEDPVRGVPQLFDSLTFEDYKVTIDWSSFDASVQPWEIDLAFALIESMLIFPNDSFQGLTRAVFHYTQALFKSRKIQSPDGSVYLRYSGIPSGSFYTHLIDSIINWIRIIYLFKKQGITIKLVRTHGDDGLIVTSVHPDIQRLANDASQYGWTLKFEKVAVQLDTSKLEFLGRTGLFGLNTRDIDRSRRLMMYPEYPVVSPQISIQRLKAIDADSGSQDPLFPMMYQYLKAKYGDYNQPLPREHRRFTITDYIAPESV